MYREGKASIKYTKDSFLNASARVPRDISVAFVDEVADRKTSVLDATAATGIRGIRYYLETPSKKVTFLDINKHAFASLKRNINLNKIKAVALNQSIQEFSGNSADKFDVIDLDPFGGVNPYIYDLMKVSRGGTHLLITATDAAVLCGADYKACLRLYDARPMHNELCKEVALRILIGYVARIAAQFNFGVDVKLSFSYMHYMRVFLQLGHGSKSALESVKKLGYAYYCGKCGYRNIESSFFPLADKCINCGNKLEIAGKLWCDSIFQESLVESLINRMASDYIEDWSGPHAYGRESIQFLRKVSKEIDMPLYYSVPKLTRKLGVGAVSDTKLMELLKKRGFRVSPTHLERDSIRTNAGIKEILKCVKNLSKGY